MSDEPEDKDVVEDDFEVEIVDDTPDEDKGRPRRPENAQGAEAEIPTDEELENYSDGVKKRISKLRYEYHEERRQKEEAQRLRDEAVAFAKNQKIQLDAFRKRADQGDAALVAQAQRRLKSELEQTVARMKAAHESGDTDEFVAANTRMAELKGEEARLSTYRPPVAAPATPAAPVAKPAAPAAQPSERARKWVSENPWFERDTEMRALALGVHERLRSEGVAIDSDAYYSELDSAIRRRFPEKFASPEPSPRRQPGPVVAPGGRSAAATPRKVPLTSSAAALAKKLGLTPEQYAQEILKLERAQKNG